MPQKDVNESCCQVCARISAWLAATLSMVTGIVGCGTLGFLVFLYSSGPKGPIFGISVLAQLNPILVMQIGLAICVPINIIHIIITALLIHALRKKKHMLMLPWIFGCGILTLALCGFSVYYGYQTYLTTIVVLIPASICLLHLLELVVIVVRFRHLSLIDRDRLYDQWD